MIVEINIDTPSSKFLTAVDAAVASIAASNNRLQQWFEDYAKYHRSRIATDLALSERFLLPEALGLDVGAAPFIYTIAMRQLGRKVHALDKDPSRFAETILRHELEVVEADIETGFWPIKNGEYDFVILNEVFEHTANLLAAFMEINRVLKPNGIVLLSTPNGISAAHIVRFITTGALGPPVFAEQRKQVTLGHMGHLREIRSDRSD